MNVKTVLGGDAQQRNPPRRAEKPPSSKLSSTLFVLTYVTLLGYSSRTSPTECISSDPAKTFSNSLGDLTNLGLRRRITTRLLQSPIQLCVQYRVPATGRLQSTRFDSSQKENLLRSRFQFLPTWPMEASGGTIEMDLEDQLQDEFPAPQRQQAQLKEGNTREVALGVQILVPMVIG